MDDHDVVSVDDLRYSSSLNRVAPGLDVATEPGREPARLRDRIPEVLQIVDLSSPHIDDEIAGHLCSHPHRNKWSADRGTCTNESDGGSDPGDTKTQTPRRTLALHQRCVDAVSATDGRRRCAGALAGSSTSGLTSTPQTGDPAERTPRELRHSFVSMTRPTASNCARSCTPARWPWTGSSARGRRQSLRQSLSHRPRGGTDDPRACDLLLRVGLRGLEPLASSLSGKRSNRLSYRPDALPPQRLRRRRLPQVGVRSQTGSPRRVHRPAEPWSRTVEGPVSRRRA